MTQPTARWMPRLAAALLAAACAGLLPTPARAMLTDPAQIMNEAYIQLVQGDQSLDAGRLEEAFAFYEQAREHYERLAREFPGFEPRIIQYRKTYCDNQITGIRRKQAMPAAGDLPPLEARAPARILPEPAVAPPGPAVPAATGRSVEIDYLNSRIDSLEAELADLDGLQEEVDRLIETNRALQQQLDQAHRQLAERESGEQEAVQSLRAELTARDERIQALQRDLDAKRQLDQALNDMEARVNELTAANARLNEEIKTLDMELDDAEVRADQAELRAEQAAKKQADAESRASIAEEELQVARALPPPSAGAEKPRADKPPKRKPDDRKKPAESARKDKPAQDKPPASAPDAGREPADSPAAAAASVPPRPIPDGLTAADFVRQLLQEGDNEAALATVQNARRAARTDMSLGLIEGIALIRLQRYAEAASLLIDIAKQNPRNAEVHATLGAAMMGAGFYDEARETLLMAIRLDKNLPECHYNLAQLYAFIEPVNLRLAARHYRNARDLGVAADPQLEAALK